MATDAVATLRQVNDSLRMARRGLRPERKHCSRITPRDLSNVVGQLLRAEECLRHWPASTPEQELELEKIEYRRNLEELKRSLPDLHVRLLAEKARLESAKAELIAKMAWARAQAEKL